MKVALQLSPEQVRKVLSLWGEEHSEYYGKPFGATVALNPITGVEEYCGYAAVKEGEKTYYRWLTAGGNVGLIDEAEGILLYLGRRHAVGGLALPLGDLIGLPEDPADWREYRDRHAGEIPVLDYETSEPSWSWWETKDDYAKLP